MTALCNRSATARTVERALAGVTTHSEPGGTATEYRRRSQRRSERADAEPDAETGNPAPTGEVDQVTLKVRAERQRIASALHDEVSQLLFAMSARARRSRELDRDDPDALHTTVGALADQLQEAQDRLRAVIRACGPAAAADTVPVATQRDLDDFTERTGTAAHLVVQGRPAHLPPAVERVALNCLRQALFNIERHANANLVMVTLDYRPDRLCLVVQDNGRGLPDGFEPRAVPSDGHHWGFTSMAEQVERLGGSVLLRRVHDDDIDGGVDGDTDDQVDGNGSARGTLLRVQLPRPTEAR